MTIPTDGRIDLDALAPCPFCGGTEAMVVDRTCDKASPYNPLDYAYPRVICKCGAQVPGKNWEHKRTAIAAWNRRAAIPSEQGEAVAWQKWHDDEAGPGWDWYISKNGNMDTAIAKELCEESATLIVNALNRLATTSPSPPALDGAGRDAVIEECAKAVRVASEQPIYSSEMRFVAGHRLGVDRSLAAIRALKETP